MSKKIERIYHTWDKWECFRAGFFDDKPLEGMTKSECEIEFANFFKDLSEFEEGLNRVIEEWRYSCEHNLTNENLNRIAWLGQAAVCIMRGIPSDFKSGYSLLSEEEQNKADDLALDYLNVWMYDNGYEEVDGKRKHKTSNIY